MISGFRALVLLMVAGLGVGGAFAMSEALRNSARQGWEAETGHAAQSLSGSMLGWLEESYAPISGLAALLENSAHVSEPEFLNAYNGLEARATAFFLDSAGLVAPVGGSGSGEWRIKYSNDLDGILSGEKRLSEYPAIMEAIEIAEARFGEVILGRPVRLPDMTAVVSPVVLGTFDSAGPMAVIGLVDFVGLSKGLFDLHVPEGVSLSIIGRFPKPDGQGAEQVVIGKRSSGALHSVTTRTVSAGAELAITWDFDERYEGGPPGDVADLALATGLAGVTLITLIIGLLQHSRGRTRAAESATRQLEIEMEQRAIAETEVRRMSKVFMDAADPILIEDLDGTIVEMNEEAESAYGWSRDELIGYSITKIVPPERHEQAIGLLGKCVAGEETRNIEGVRWKKSGERLNVLLTLSRLTDEAGEPVAVATLAKDISDLKEAEQKLHR
ncbi:MAG: PAS domain S-box protein, partial [Alphaproteobacteria bacterium]|nr:PAS domain S-box protein [Alphaproteobacteria bacterium]